MTAPQDDEAPTTDRMIDDGLPAAITPEAVADDDDLAELVEAIVRADPNARGLSGRPAGLPAGPPRIRTCRFPASGSSCRGFAP